MHFLTIQFPLWVTIVSSIVFFSLGYFFSVFITKANIDSDVFMRAFIFIIIVAAWSMQTFGSPFIDGLDKPDFWLNILFSTIAGSSFSGFKDILLSMLSLRNVNSITKK